MNLIFLLKSFEYVSDSVLLPRVAMLFVSSVNYTCSLLTIRSVGRDFKT